jgi:hypothetical protein
VNTSNTGHPEQEAQAAQGSQPLSVAGEMQVWPERHEDARWVRLAGRVAQVAQRQRDAVGDAGSSARERASASIAGDASSPRT